MTPVPLPQQLVTRERLLDKLRRQSSVTVLRAPTGFGKTTLVQQWIEQRSVAEPLVVTVRVRPGEGDAGSFWIAVMEALTDAGFAEPALLHARSPQSSATRMITAADRPLTLWVDSFENVTTPAADEVLLDLVHHVDGFRLIIGTRSHRHFGVHLFSELDTTVVNATDLLFTPGETAAAVTAAGLDLPSADVASIHEGFGGWPELIRTYAVAFRDKASSGLDVTSTMDQLLIDWLRRRLLPGVNRPELVELAVVSALPDRISFELAEQLTGDPNAKARLEELIADGALLPAPGSDGAIWFQWPPTARRALLVELRRRDPDRVPQLHERLARWHVDHHDPATALRHAVAGAVWGLAVQIIDDSWRELLLSHRSELNEAMLALPADAILSGRRPLRPSRAVRTLFLRTDDPAVNVEALPASADALEKLGRAADAPCTLSTGLSVLVALRTPRRLGEATVFAERLVRVANAARVTQAGEVADLYPSVHLYAGETYLSAGEVALATPHLEEAYQRAGDSSVEHLESDAAGKLALASALAGDLPRASSWITRHEEAPEPVTWLAPYIRSSANVARLLVAVDRLDITRATEIGNGLLGDVLPDVRWAQELYARGLLAVHTGTAASVLEQIDHTRRRHLAIPEVSEPLVAAVEADMLIAMGQGNQARAVLHGEHRDHRLLRVGQARLALLSGDPETALRLATDAEWIRQARYRQRQEMVLVRAVAAHRVGDAPTAVHALQVAVAAARATGAVRPFVTVPRADLTAIAAQVPAAAEVLDAPPVADSREAFSRTIGLIELTPREQQVLDRIAAGLSIRQVAIDLHVAYSTVRTQQRSLYRKLGVASQEDAVARARQAGLLSPARRPAG